MESRLPIKTIPGKNGFEFQFYRLCKISIANIFIKWCKTAL